MKTSEKLARQLEETRARYNKDYDELYSKVKKPTKEQLKPLIDMLYMIDKLEHDVIKEQRREIEVGDGCTLNLYTDRNAYTVIRKTKKTIVMQRDKAIIDKSFKPEWVEGGFSAICINQYEQKYSYEQDPNGSIIRAFWCESVGCYVHNGCKVTNGRHEFYDYNF